MNQKLKDIISSLDADEKEALFRHLLKEHIKEDIVDRCEACNVDYDDDFIEKATSLYVDDGEYDYNASHWENIHGVMEAALEGKAE